jgi:hypothetical protein
MKRGQCSICGSYGEFTFDHVPPQRCIAPSMVELLPLSKLLTETPRIGFSGGKTEDGKLWFPNSAISQNGMKFRTICSKCNNARLGGKYDPELNRVALEVAKIASAVNAGLVLPQASVVVEAQSHALMKAVIGHLLAVTSYDEFDFYSKLREYFLRGDLPLPEGVVFYYWPYPFRKPVIAKRIMVASGETIVTGDLLKFFPLAFFVADVGASTGTLGTQSIIGCGCNDMECRIKMNFNFAVAPPPNWPELPDRAGRVTMMQAGAGVVAKSRKRRTPRRR